ncbi:MAG TPA: hypothetical protein VK835_07525 [Bacteroidia bacterium]|jgi:hypothetical protein|nr:hypothetical protein [Bacteroidia bacterium]
MKTICAIILLTLTQVVWAQPSPDSTITQSTANNGTHKIYYYKGYINQEIFTDNTGFMYNYILYYKSSTQKQSQDIHIKNDTSVSVNYYKSGQISSEFVSNSNRTMKWRKTYKANGQLKHFYKGPAFNQKQKNSRLVKH